MIIYFKVLKNIENLNTIKFIEYFEKIKESLINVNNHSIIVIIYLINYI